MKKYKLILNLGSTEEKTSYFERLSTKKLLTIIKDKSNLLLEFDDFFNCYLPRFGSPSVFFFVSLHRNIKPKDNDKQNTVYPIHSHDDTGGTHLMLRNRNIR